MSGTTANLRSGDKISIKDLLYCLMLPSGNDAAYSLSENIGAFIYFEMKCKLHTITENNYFFNIN
jgi:D-alanyl-D-alanine carboxypeptidase